MRDEVRHPALAATPSKHAAHIQPPLTNLTNPPRLNHDQPKGLGLGRGKVKELEGRRTMPANILCEGTFYLCDGVPARGAPPGVNWLQNFRVGMPPTPLLPAELTQNTSQQLVRGARRALGAI